MAEDAPLTDCTANRIEFSKLGRRRLEAEFSGGEVSSDGGLLLLREVDRRDALGSAPTLCRLENRASRAAAWALHRELVETFIASFTAAPAELVLNFDATDDPLHGKQEERFFHGYYDGYCYLPLYARCGEQLLVSYLRPSKIDGAQHAWAILALLVKRLRQAWPEVRIVLRADRTACHHFVTNQFRLLLSSLAYVLVERLRTLAGTEFARLQATTLRAKLFKIGAVIVRNTRRVRVMLSSAYPYQDIFHRAAVREIAQKLLSPHVAGASTRGFIACSENRGSHETCGLGLAAAGRKLRRLFLPHPLDAGLGVA